jgi:hypothetical protein
VTGQRGQGNIAEKVGVKNGSSLCSAQTQIFNHFRKDNTITLADRIINKEVNKARCKDNPSPMKGPFFFHEAFLISQDELVFFRHVK